MKIPEKIIIKKSNLGDKGLFAKNPIKKDQQYFVLRAGLEQMKRQMRNQCK